MGKGGIYQNLNDIPDFPLMPGRDYMVEGTQIRAPNNGTLPGTLYWYGIAQPDNITAISQPALMPEASRELIAVEAVRQFRSGVRPQREVGERDGTGMDRHAGPSGLVADVLPCLEDTVQGWRRVELLHRTRHRPHGQQLSTGNLTYGTRFSLQARPLHQDHD